MWLATVSYYFSVYSKVSFWCNIYFLFSRKSLISICFWCGVYKPLLASVLCINIDTIYEPHVYICFLFNIEMKWWSKSILFTKLPLPSAFFLSQRTDGERWCFKLLSAVVCSAASMAGLWVLARKLSLHAGTTESALTPPILQVACQWLTGSVPLHSHCPLTACRPQDTLGSKPFLLVASHRLVPTAAVFLIPPFCVDLRSRLPAQQNSLSSEAFRAHHPSSFMFTVPVHVVGLGAGWIGSPCPTAPFPPLLELLPFRSLCLKLILVLLYVCVPPSFKV